MIAWLGATALFWWIHVVAFGQPTIERTMAVFMGLGSLFGAAFAKWGPTLPFRGRAPEEEAARSFFAGEDVRSDDHRFEQELEP